MTVEEAISAIIKQHGIEILCFPNKVQSMIMDFANGYERDVQLFCYSCQKGLLRYAQKLVSMKKDVDIQDLALSAKDMLQHDAFMSEKYAVYTINMLLNGLGLTFRIELVTQEKGRYTEKNFLKKQSLSKEKRVHIDEKLLGDLRESAQNGNADAFLSLGNCYFYGIGVIEDWFIAESYYRKAYKYGNRDEKEEANRKIIEIYNRRQIDIEM